MDVFQPAELGIQLWDQNIHLRIHIFCLFSQNQEIYRYEIMKNGVEGWGGVHRGTPHRRPKKRSPKRNPPHPPLPP